MESSIIVMVIAVSISILCCYGFYLIYQAYRDESDVLADALLRHGDEVKQAAEAQKLVTPEVVSKAQEVATFAADLATVYMDENYGLGWEECRPHWTDVENMETHRCLVKMLEPQTQTPIADIVTEYDRVVDVTLHDHAGLNVKKPTNLN